MTRGHSCYHLIHAEWDLYSWWLGCNVILQGSITGHIGRSNMLEHMDRSPNFRKKSMTNTAGVSFPKFIPTLLEVHTLRLWHFVHIRLNYKKRYTKLDPVFHCCISDIQTLISCFLSMYDFHACRCGLNMKSLTVLGGGGSFGSGV
jgi:hypothetical protein